MDPEMFDIIEKEKKRQQESVDLIPSEVSLATQCIHRHGAHAALD